MWDSIHKDCKADKEATSWSSGYDKIFTIVMFPMTNLVAAEGCHDFALNMTSLTLNRLQSMNISRKNCKKLFSHFKRNTVIFLRCKYHFNSGHVWQVLNNVL